MPSSALEPKVVGRRREAPFTGLDAGMAHISGSTPGIGSMQNCRPGPASGNLCLPMI